MDDRITWDGQPVSREKPYGAAVIVYLRTADTIKFLLLHRAFHELNTTGDWTWTPPSGARYPGETIEACAARELLEETGLELPVSLTDFGSPEWYVFNTEMKAEKAVRLDSEHDYFGWFLPAEALRLCKPGVVRQPLERLCQMLSIPYDELD